MCGIAGFISQPSQYDHTEGKRKLDIMTDALLHRGPDARGVWSDEENGIFLGHRRLSILDLSPMGAQPMTSQCGRYVTSYNGEIYNTGQLLMHIRQVRPDIEFRGHSDTEIMLEGFATLGIKKTLNVIKGMFAIALWDRHKKTLTLIRDHVGKKPLYIGIIDQNIVFSSELKSIVAFHGKRPEINQDALRSYRYFGFIPTPSSIYKNVFKLRPAHYIVLKESDLRPTHADKLIPKMQSYWSLKKAPIQIPYSDAKEALEQQLLQAVSQRMMSDVPLGAFLSGGIDSSLISAMMQAQSKKPIKTYSIGFNDGAYDESKHAQNVARHLKTDHTTYMVSPHETLDIIPNLQKIYDEPFADYSQIPTAVLCAQARKDTIVALSGDGGDEVFCGYKRYFMLKKLIDHSSHIPLAARKALAAMLKAIPQNVYNAAHLNGKRMHSIGGFLQEDNLDNAILRSLSIQPDLPQPDNLYLGGDNHLSTLERMMEIDTHLYLPDDILVKVDRASMHSSLEVRCPLLDKDVIEIAWSLRIEDKIFNNKGRGKKPLYDLLCNYVPQEIIDRPKQGFTPPMASWLRNELKAWACDLVHTDTPVIDKEEAITMWDDFQKGKTDNHSALWGVLMAQSWYLDT